MAIKPSRQIVQRARRLEQIFKESAEIIRTTENRETELSRIDVAIKAIIELKGISEKYKGIETENLYLIDYQLTKAKYELIKDEFENEDEL